MGAPAPTDAGTVIPPTPPDPADGIVASRGAAPGAIVRVEPITTARALKGPFDYVLGEELRQSAAVGSMLVVPFGARKLLGVVVELADSSEVSGDRSSVVGYLAAAFGTCR